MLWTPASPPGSRPQGVSRTTQHQGSPCHARLHTHLTAGSASAGPCSMLVTRAPGTTLAPLHTASRQPQESRPWVSTQSPRLQTCPQPHVTGWLWLIWAAGLTHHGASVPHPAQERAPPLPSQWVKTKMCPSCLNNTGKPGVGYLFIYLSPSWVK